MLVFLIRIKALLKPTRIIETDFSSPDKKIEPRIDNYELSYYNNKDKIYQWKVERLVNDIALLIPTMILDCL